MDLSSGLGCPDHLLVWFIFSGAINSLKYWLRLCYSFANLSLHFQSWFLFWPKRRISETSCPSLSFVCQEELMSWSTTPVVDFPGEWSIRQNNRPSYPLTSFSFGSVMVPVPTKVITKFAGNLTRLIMLPNIIPCIIISMSTPHCLHNKDTADTWCATDFNYFARLDDSQDNTSTAVFSLILKNLMIMAQLKHPSVL